MKLIPAITLFCLALGVFWIGCNIGPDYEDVKAYMETEAYKAQERAHFERVKNWN